MRLNLGKAGSASDISNWLKTHAVSDSMIVVLDAGVLGLALRIECRFEEVQIGQILRRGLFAEASSAMA